MAKLFLFDCDPFKNDSCSKEDCYIYGGHCSKTSIKGYSKTKTNQDKIAEIVRMADHEILAKMIFEGGLEAIMICDNCPAKEYCDERMKYNENNPEFVTCEMVMNEWLVKEV